MIDAMATSTSCTAWLSLGPRWSDLSATAFEKSREKQAFIYTFAIIMGSNRFSIPEEISLPEWQSVDAAFELHWSNSTSYLTPTRTGQTCGLYSRFSHSYRWSEAAYIQWWENVTFLPKVVKVLCLNENGNCIVYLVKSLRMKWMEFQKNGNNEMPKVPIALIFWRASADPSHLTETFPIPSEHTLPSSMMAGRCTWSCRAGMMRPLPVTGSLPFIISLTGSYG